MGNTTLFTPEKDGSIPFYVDYRKLNVVTIRESYLLPRMDNGIDSLGEGTVF